MLSLSDQLAELPDGDRDEILSGYTDGQLTALLHDWRGFHARPNQIAPDGEWDIWMVLAGRGFGKTRSGAEWVREQVKAGKRRIALVAETQKDLEEVMIEGDSGILSVCPADERPEYRKKPVQLTFPCGAIALGYNATQPDQLRGPQFDAAWCDEIAKWRYARETWDQLQFGMRLGDDPRQMVTTTPRPIELVKSLIAGEEGQCVVTKGSTQDNAANLASAFLRKIKKKYEGTRLGRQELNAEVLGDMPGSLWPQATLDAYRVHIAPSKDELKRVVVAVDPAVTNTEDSDDHGIIVAAITDDNEGRILADESLKGSPLTWAKRAVSLYHSNMADAIVVEVNQGGDMVEHTIRSVDPNVNVIQVRATRGKHVRAAPIAALYEQGRVKHVGCYPELETQMNQMTPDGFQGDGSPDRVDALVWAFTELFPGLTERITDVSRFDIAPASGWMGS